MKMYTIVSLLAVLCSFAASSLVVAGPGPSRKDSPTVAEKKIQALEAEIQRLQIKMSKLVQEIARLKRENVRLKKAVAEIEKQAKHSDKSKAEPTRKDAKEGEAKGKKRLRTFRVSDIVAEQKAYAKVDTSNPIQRDRWRRHVKEKYGGQRFAFSNATLKGMWHEKGKDADVMELNCVILVGGDYYVKLPLKVVMRRGKDVFKAVEEKLAKLKEGDKLSGSGTIERVNVYWKLGWPYGGRSPIGGVRLDDAKLK